jgi:phenylalanyl-tRNA synthetase alpha subunit
MMLEQFTQIGDAARADLAAVTDAESLEAFRIQYLGKKGSVTGMLSMIGKLPKEQKREGGQLANQIKQEITAAFDALKADLGASTKKTAPMIDVTLPGVAVAQGKSHIISQTVSELLEIFGRMGFDIAYGPEVEDDWHNFIALNIPPEHPARDPIDNFYIDDSTLLRSQTSTIQIRVMENTAPPIRVVAPGRVYRPDTVDAWLSMRVSRWSISKAASTSLSTHSSEPIQNGDSARASSRSPSQAARWTSSGSISPVTKTGWRSAVAAWLTRMCLMRSISTAKNIPAGRSASASSGWR